MYVESDTSRRRDLGIPGSCSLTGSATALRLVEPHRPQQLPVHSGKLEGALDESILRSLTVPWNLGIALYHPDLFQNLPS
jgi:hypothetical protein